MEHKIGEKIKFPNGEVVEVKEEPKGVCTECIFYSLHCGAFRYFGIIGECEAIKRKDHKSIIYKEVKEEKMATIEERAFDFAMKETKEEGFDFGSVKDGYVEGATEQRKIDIDRACEWLKVNTPIIHAEDGDYVRMIGKANISMEAYLHDFRKAMEE